MHEDGSSDRINRTRLRSNVSTAGSKLANPSLSLFLFLHTRLQDQWAALPLQNELVLHGSSPVGQWTLDSTTGGAYLNRAVSTFGHTNHFQLVQTSRIRFPKILAKKDMFSYPDSSTVKTNIC